MEKKSLIDYFITLPDVLEIIIWIVILILIIGLVGAIIWFIIGLRKKVESSEKVTLSKSELKLEEIETKVDTAIDNQKVIMDEIKK